MTRRNFPSRVKARRKVALEGIERRIREGWYKKAEDETQEEAAARLAKAETEAEVLRSKTSSILGD